MNPIISQLIVMIPTVLTIIIAAWLQRRAANDRAEQAALERAKEARKADASRHEISNKLDTHAAVVEQIAQDVDGNLSAITEVTRKYAAEILRLQETGTSTPTGRPSTETPVTLDSGVVSTTPDRRRTDDQKHGEDGPDTSHAPERAT